MTTASPPPTGYDEALRFLLGRFNFERIVTVPYRSREYKLERMHELLDRLERPQDKLRLVHIAGTKGKGSTAAMLSAVCVSAGYRTGMLTSPHLDRLEERIAIDGRPCEPNQLVELVNRLRPIVEQMDREAERVAGSRDSAPTRGPTYFELTTALALMHFADQAVDLALLEVGMGGRLDSTNVCRPLCSVITSISFDHVRQLGNSLAAIAAEKAGIIKRGVPVVSGAVDSEPRAVIERIARERSAPLVQRGDDFDFEYRAPRLLDAHEARGDLDFRGTDAFSETWYESMSLGLLGRHQAANAAVALAVTQVLRNYDFRFNETALRLGLATARCGARIEVIGTQPTVIVDAAHNVASIRALVEVLDESFGRSHRVLLFATTKEKDIRGMLKLLIPRFDQIVFTRYLNNPRSVPPQRLVGEAEAIAAARNKNGGDGDIKAAWQIAENPAQAWAAAQKASRPESLVCVTGSFFIAAEVRCLIKEAAPHRAGDGRLEAAAR